MSQMEPVEDGDTLLVARRQHRISNRYMVALIERSIRSSGGSWSTGRHDWLLSTGVFDPK